MLLSMTGYGDAHLQVDGLGVAVELRTINSRYFKLLVKCAEGYSVLESDMENLIRQQIRRGTVQLNLRVDRAHSSDDFRIDKAVLAGYRSQLEDLRAQWGTAGDVRLAELLMLPGVVAESPLGSSDAAADWPAIKQALSAALANLAKMRAQEGQAMSTDLRANCRLIGQYVDLIEQRAPEVAAGYRQRLEERLKKTLAEFEVTLAPADVLKEASIFAERSDISEELVRLRSHLVQFDQFMAEAESAGRKLEFLTQEMFREINTVGSKAGDVEISKHVIEVKAAIEKIREMIQNVE